MYANNLELVRDGTCTIIIVDKSDNWLSCKDEYMQQLWHAACYYVSARSAVI